MAASDIVIKGAREHNLRDVDVVLPRNQLICLTGVSGSGKSSLAFDTLFAEGQRRYVESLSSFARQFLGQMPKPDVDYIAGLRPSISISQKSTGNNPRSTVGTITEIYDFLRVLFARVGEGFCPKCGQPIQSQTREQIVTRILQLPDKTRFTVLAPVIRGQKGEWRDLFEDLLKQGFVRARVDGETHSLSDNLQLDRRMRHNIEVVVDRLAIKSGLRTRLAESVELALKIGSGSLIVEVEEAQGVDLPSVDEAGAELPSDSNTKGRQDIVFSIDYSCGACGISFEPPSPQLFSFNSPQGMCVTCDGLGQLFSFDPDLLIPDERLSFKRGAIELVGPWKEMGRWRRHIFQGVADTMERKLGLAAGTMLETPWCELDEPLRQLWLHGTGDEHVTFQWRGGASPIKYGGKFDGVVPDLLAKYRGSKSKPQLRQLEKYMRSMGCPDCGGQRLNRQARAVKLTSVHPWFADQPTRSLPEVCRMSIADASDFFSELRLDPTRAVIAAEALKEIRGRLGFLMNVGLDYLALDRTAPTLSGGESQRIRLAGQIGSGLVGVLYILDEPSIGLHPRDNDRLLATLARLRDMGNTVVVVEHDEDTMRAADLIIDFGPGPGVRGGEVVAVGPADKIAREKRSVTGQFLAGSRAIEVPKQRRIDSLDSQPTLRMVAESNADYNGRGRRGRKSAAEAANNVNGSEASSQATNVLRVIGAAHNNLKHVDVEIPLGAFVCVTGVSGSGKSSLVNDILVEALRRDLNGGEGEPGLHDRIEGLEHLDKLIAIDQSPIGRTPRSNPGTYIKVFDDIRALFTQLPDSKRRGFKPGRFSFNVIGGRCEACEGNGSNRLEMDFLADVWVTCPVCEGHRYNRETLQVRYKDRSIADVLEMDVQQALELFENVPNIQHKLQTLHDVGLDYLKLGQPSPTLSGGEAQRIKLARELVKKSTGRTLYLLDEPTTGLHFADIQLLLKVLHDFVELGNTVLVVEHNLDVIKTADWLIDLGPEGGSGGGEIVACGTPETLAGIESSYTGQALAKVLQRESTGSSKKTKSPRHGRPTKSGSNGKVQLAKQITVQNAHQHNLKGVDVTVDRDKMTVFCGPSGSGKSSLAMDTIYAEGQRRYVESLSSYARQFVSQMQKPAVDHIDGLSPAIAIEQKNLGHTPRSTVGTVTEIYDYLRILMARLGTPHCPRCDVPVGTQTADQVIDKIMQHDDGTRLMLAAPIEISVGEKYETYWEELRGTGYARVRIDGQTYSLDEVPEIDRRRKHDVEVVVDRIVVKTGSRSRIADSVEHTLSLGKGVLHAIYPHDDLPEPRWQRVVHSQHLACHSCGRSFEPLTPHNFSFNSQLGWCPSCEGLGTQVGANPAALLRDPKLTLAEGALALWPNVALPMSQAMLAALSKRTGLPLDVPFDQLGARHRRLIMHGAGDDWFDVTMHKDADESGLTFRFQFKGLYPALEEASRLSPSLRNRLEQFVGEVDCSTCSASRLRDDASAVRFQNRTIDELCRLPLGQLQREVSGWKLAARDRQVAGELLREITNRVQFLNDVGLEYLTLSRGAATLSNGEAQRIRLASQLGSGLCGVLYVLDEPTIGLHPRDNTRLLKALHKLRDLGNTLIVVEHDREVIEGCDAICDFGPAAGRLGGEVVAQGSPSQLGRRRGSVTGPYLTGKKSIGIPNNRRLGQVNEKANEKRNGKATGKAKAAPTPLDQVHSLRIINARHRNLRGIDVTIPLETLTAITGPSGSGKSSLVNDVLYATLARTLHRASVTPGAHDEIRGLEHINKVIRVDQTPLGNSPTSNPATYTGVFDKIRELFAQLPDAKVRGYSPRRFSFNVPGGRCEDCEGNGQKCIEMHFLPDVWVECETCRGKRYNPETLAIQFHGQSISDVLEMTCGDAVQLFQNIPSIRRILQTLCDVGLDYLTLGQSAPTLSGGEAQRVKLAAELARPNTGRTLYLLDEPTTGLHFDDLAKLLEVMQRLVDLGNTVVVIEHNLDVIKQADWVIDMGPEAGEAGGQVVVAGTPEYIVEYAAAQGRASAARSYTGEALAPVLAAGPYVQRPTYSAEEHAEAAEDKFKIAEVIGDAAMPWEKDGRGWHTRDRVGRNGEPCRWDGRILADVIDRIHELGTFSETNWNSRSVVEIAAETKSYGWFLHAITGETWLLKLKFRVPSGTFQQTKLRGDLPLKTLNEMYDIPLYSNDPRIKVKSTRGPLQEIELRLHSYEEVDRPAFWHLLETAVEAFQRFANDAQKTLEEHMPWKKLGQKWHFMRKGFPTGKRIVWEIEVLESLCKLLEQVAPDGQFTWTNQQLAHMHVPGQKEPWATLHTKRPGSLDLTLTGPKGQIGFGRVSELGFEREFDDKHAQRDQIQLRFRNVDDLQRGDLHAFLSEHLAGVSATAVNG